MPSTTIRSLIALALLALPTAGCREEQAPVAEVRVAAEEVTLAYPQAVRLDTVWEPTAPLAGLAGPLFVFVHLRGADGEMLRTFDHPYPGAWEVGSRVEHSIELWQSALGPPLPAGSYELALGLYSPAGGRWPLAIAGRQVDEAEYAVARVVVPELPLAGPELLFSPDWRPLEAGMDRQVLARRWLEGAGGIELRGLSGPLRVGLGLRLPQPEELRHRLVLDEGAETPAVTVGSDCAPEPAVASGFGRHRIDLLLVPAVGASACGLQLEPNFAYLDLDTLERLSVDLERIVWAAPES